MAQDELTFLYSDDGYHVYCFDGKCNGSVPNNICPKCESTAKQQDKGTYSKCMACGVRIYPGWFICGLNNCDD